MMWMKNDTLPELPLPGRNHREYDPVYIALALVCGIATKPSGSDVRKNKGIFRWSPTHRSSIAFCIAFSVIMTRYPL